MEQRRREIAVGGFTPFTTIDYPGMLSAVVFCQGCPMACRYCFNSDLIKRRNTGLISWEKILNFLDSRKGFLDAVVFSGGEPTQQTMLKSAIKQVKDIGFKVGLHTSGAYPKRLRRIIDIVDWIGLDIKAVPDKYEDATGMKGSGKLVLESAKIIIESSTDYQFRTTINAKDAEGKAELQGFIGSLAPKKHVWQEMKIKTCDM